MNSDHSCKYLEINFKKSTFYWTFAIPSLTNFRWKQQNQWNQLKCFLRTDDKSWDGKETAGIYYVTRIWDLEGGNTASNFREACVRNSNTTVFHIGIVCFSANQCFNAEKKTKLWFWIESCWKTPKSKKNGTNGFTAKEKLVLEKYIFHFLAFPSKHVFFQRSSNLKIVFCEILWTNRMLSVYVFFRKKNRCMLSGSLELHFWKVLFLVAAFGIFILLIEI